MMMQYMSANCVVKGMKCKLLYTSTNLQILITCYMPNYITLQTFIISNYWLLRTPKF